jgi:hypothetical protein
MQQALKKPEEQPQQELAPQEENKAGFIIVYAAVAFSGFLIGLLAGCLLWRR